MKRSLRLTHQSNCNQIQVASLILLHNSRRIDAAFAARDQQFYQLVGPKPRISGRLRPQTFDS